MAALHRGFTDVGIMTHFSIEDYNVMGHPESVMLLMSLLTILPHYIAKTQHVLFSCTLGA